MPAGLEEDLPRRLVALGHADRLPISSSGVVMGERGQAHHAQRVLLQAGAEDLDLGALGCGPDRRCRRRHRRPWRCRRPRWPPSACWARRAVPSRRGRGRRRCRPRWRCTCRSAPPSAATTAGSDELGQPAPRWSAVDPARGGARAAAAVVPEVASSSSPPHAVSSAAERSGEGEPAGDRSTAPQERSAGRTVFPWSSMCVLLFGGGASRVVGAESGGAGARRAAQRALAKRRRTTPSREAARP